MERAITARDSADLNVHLDKLDLQLLYWMDINCRVSLTSLAKKLHTSPAKLRYRLGQLVKGGVIENFITLINYGLYGFRAYSLYYKLKEIDDKELEALISKITKLPDVTDLLLTYGAFDMQIVLLDKSIDEMAEAVWKIRETLEEYVIEETMGIRLKGQLFTRQMFLEEIGDGKVTKPRIVFEIRRKSEGPDEIDDKILYTISQNANWPVWRIAKEVKAGGPTVYSRIKRLEKNGIIVGYTTKMTPNLRGFHLYRVFMKLHYISKERKEEIIAYLNQHHLVYRSSLIFGDFDLQYDARLADGSALRSLLHEIYKQFSDAIIRQDWVRVHKTLKFGYYRRQDK
ncbi:hypothetical protein COU37_02620 [Candidatus Micrarchaeota archaeon CG10_big_fil_rev_8_21_14_0_10_45_29]|nr:MAG: hypothetical protein COU37_02620 [Candidatus Micrarchaeota archaeon CG10_big_fil_rev_8_21_14_0_10_45_29]